MKYHSILTPALTSLCLLTSHNTLANNVKEERWFEIEVIIFKQLADNSKNTEQFSSNDLRAKKSNARDLLAPYLQPDITSLKQLLPHCGKQDIQLPYDLTNTPYSLLTASNDTDESLLQIEGEAEQNSTEGQLKDAAENKTLATPTGTMSVTVMSEEDNDTPQDENHNDDEQDFQAQFTALELPAYNQYPTSNKMPLCVIPAEYFQQHLTAEQLESFNFNGFPVEKLTSTINGLEQWRDDETDAITWASDSPYLISKDSLRLKSIASRIKRSRNYAPLLHLGWRQVGESKRKAKAMKLYAGEHLDLRYQQAMAKQESQQQALEIQAILEKREKTEALMGKQMPLSGGETTQVTSKNIESSETFNEISIAEELRQQAKQQQLDTLFKQLSMLDSQLSSETKTNELDANSETTLTMATTKRIVEQLSSDISLEDIPLSANNVIDEQQQAIPPLQPWSIDGLFKVHLDHYLYIDTEFNIIEPTSASPMINSKEKLANKESDHTKVISFKQDRRVITGEIHYFDHPHIGMVVQIRRFDPTKPADEAVSQSKK
ncbi:CsiV family protein [Colwellia psychrerythraea]|uniref:Lipoprotein n=1 Tax=Colwellia psychrerythraea TaxID=28229 RepID=A0A099KSP6_COLPS|nr:CsiV family protein [Colwellia psychrerythraea]KGJ93546.1 Protein of unknown function DUF2803 [Colwellia psychrerythraea]